jgi:hypothetical protein
MPSAGAATADSAYGNTVIANAISPEAARVKSYSGKRLSLAL